MAFEQFEWAEFKDEMYDQLIAGTKGELQWLQNEFSPYDVDADGNYDALAFNNFHDWSQEEEIPEFQNTFEQDTIA